MINAVRYGILLLLCLSLFGQANAQSSAQIDNRIDQLMQRMRAAPFVKGQFTQSRSLPGLSKPLVSNGQFIYWQGQGIYWQTDSPLPQAITYSYDKTISWMSPGIPAGIEHNSRRDQHFRRILLALFSFDPSQLEQRFNSDWQISPDHWQLTLTPSDRITAYAIRSAELSGGKHIEQIRITTANDELLNIEFSEQRTQATVPFDLCINQFALSISRCNQLTADD